jgi:fructose-bisphosphate aldolase class II
MQNIKSLSEFHKRAKSEGWAVGHFNFSSLSQLRGIIFGAKAAKAPVVVGTSENERRFIGDKMAVTLVRELEEETGIPIFLNADHCHSFESAIAAFEAGYDSVHIDLSKKPFRKNLEETRRIVDFIKTRKETVEVEGELGQIITDSSEVYREDIEVPQTAYTKIEEAVEFVEKTGIDRFAPSVGNIHGIAKNPPRINIPLIKELKNSLLKDVTLVLHGGSGIVDRDIKSAISAGIANIHISTEVRLAYTRALQEFFSKNPDEIAPYKYLEVASLSVLRLVEKKIKLFGAEDKL